MWTFDSMNISEASKFLHWKNVASTLTTSGSVNWTQVWIDTSIFDDWKIAGNTRELHRIQCSALELGSKVSRKAQKPSFHDIPYHTIVLDIPSTPRTFPPSILELPSTLFHFFEAHFDVCFVVQISGCCWGVFLFFPPYPIPLYVSQGFRNRGEESCERAHQHNATGRKKFRTAFFGLIPAFDMLEPERFQCLVGLFLRGVSDKNNKHKKYQKRRPRGNAQTMYQQESDHGTKIS